MRSSLKLLRKTYPYTRSDYSKSACKLQKQAVKEYANDGTGLHIHQANQYCVRPECPTITCTKLCDDADGLEIKGHNTHKPPIGRFSRFISDKDSNGDSRSQYFVPTNKPHVISEAEKQKHGSKIKPDSKAESYIKNNDKYE